MNKWYKTFLEPILAKNLPQNMDIKLLKISRAYLITKIKFKKTQNNKKNLLNTVNTNLKKV